jgi:archaellum component FlaC
MKAILYVIAILAAGGAAYFTVAHTEKFETVQAERLESIRANKVVSANADATDKTIADQEASLKEAKEKEALAQASVEALSSTVNSLRNENNQLDSTLATQKQEFANLEEALEEVNKVLAELGGNVTLDELPDRIAEIEQNKKDQEARLSELTTLIEGGRKQVAANRSEAQRLAERKDRRTARIRGNAMEAVVTAVNPEWGFVVIGAGSNSGFTPQTSLLVKRGDTFVGRVKPSSIEPGQTIAEIDEKSLSPGVRLQPGDRVILAQPAGD